MSVAAHAAPTRNPLAGVGRAVTNRVAAVTAALAHAAAALRAKATTIRSAVLQLAGLAAFTVSAWMLAPAAGIAVAGLACFVLNWLLSDSGADDAEAGQR